MAAQGFVALHRKLMDNPVWCDPNYLKLWLYCLFKASHKEHEQLVGNQLIKLQRGQFITGREALADDMNRGVKPKQRLDALTWFRYLKNLEKWGMLNIKTTNKYSVVTVVNYDFYQSFGGGIEQQIEQQMNNKRTTNEQQMNTNNNVNNINKSSSSSSEHPLIDEGLAQVNEFYRQNLQKGVSESPFVMELIEQWEREMGHELVLAAMKISAKAEKRGFDYTEGILKRWQKAGVKTLDDARKYEMEFKNQKAKRRGQARKTIDWEAL